MRNFRDKNGTEWEYDEGHRLGDPSGMGEVFYGRSAADGSPVAVKRVGLRFPTIGEERRREREIEIADRLTTATRAGEETAHLVLPIGYSFVDGDLLIVMPLAEGSLNAALADGPFDVNAGLAAVRQVAQGLVELAAISIVHRDLKPANVLRYRGAWKITDFGLSRILSEATGSYTLAGWGTQPYIAPELWRNQPATAKSDLYALGVVAYEVFTGERPFAGPREDDYRRQHLTEPAPAPAGLPPRLTRLILRLLSKASTDRPQDARAVIEAIDNLALRLVPHQEALVEAAQRRERVAEQSRIAATVAASANDRVEAERDQARADLTAILHDAYDEIREALPDAVLDASVPQIAVGGLSVRFRMFPPISLPSDGAGEVILVGVADLGRGLATYGSLSCRRGKDGRLRWETSLPERGAFADPRQSRLLDGDAVIEMLRAALEDSSR